MPKGKKGTGPYSKFRAPKKAPTNNESQPQQQAAQQAPQGGLESLLNRVQETIEGRMGKGSFGALSAFADRRMNRAMEAAALETIILSAASQLAMACDLPISKEQRTVHRLLHDASELMEMAVKMLNERVGPLPFFTAAQQEESEETNNEEQPTEINIERPEQLLQIPGPLGDAFRKLVNGEAPGKPVKITSHQRGAVHELPAAPARKRRRNKAPKGGPLEPEYVETV